MRDAKTLKKIYNKNMNYHPTEKAIKYVLEAIEINKIDVKSKYDLFLITSYLQEVMPKSIERETSRVNCCSDVTRVVDWLKEKKLI